MTYKYHNVTALGDIHRPDDIEYANQAARLAGAGITADHVGHIVQQTDVESFWIVTGSGPATFSAFTPPAPAVGDIGKSVVVESDGAGGVRFAYDTGGSLWSRAGTVLSPQTAGNTLTVGAGAVGAPSYSIAGDTDTGLYSVGANQLGIAAGGVLQGTYSTGGLALVNDLTLSGTGSQIVLTSNTLTSGVVVDVKVTPSGPGTGTVMRLEADSASWSGGEVLRLISDDVQALPLVINNGSTDTAYFRNTGSLNIDGTNAVITMESHTATSGNVVSIKSTPGSASTAKVCVLHADGTNWAANSRVLEIISDDNDAKPLVVNDGGSDVINLLRNGSIEIAGNLNILTGGNIQTTANGDITLLPNGTGITIVGDAGSPGFASGNDSLYVSGQLEVDSSSSFGNALYMANNYAIQSSAASYGSLVCVNTAQTIDAITITTGTVGNYLLLCENADVGFDWALPQQTTPTLAITGATQNTTHILTLAHNDTDGVIDCLTGTLNLGGTANVNFAGASMGGGTVTHDDYVEMEVGGVVKKFMTGS